MAKKVKTINPKDTQKTAIKEEIRKMLTDFGDISEGKDFGFTKDTLVLHAEICDIQIKLIAPKTGQLRYDTDEE